MKGGRMHELIGNFIVSTVDGFFFHSTENWFL
jgi:hypothetical protein